MPTGKVKFWNPARGFGFIDPDDGSPDLIMHVSAVLSSTELRHDQHVPFEIEMNEKKRKPEAKRVRVL